MTASFNRVDVTPPVGTRKIGWLMNIVGDHVIDPLYARVCVLQSGGEQIAFVQLDTLSVSRRQVADVRRRVEKEFGFPGRNVMVIATHNHAGPAIVRCGEVKPDEEYVEALTQEIVKAFGEALDRQEEAEIGFAKRANFTVPNNRRVVMRDGVVRTHGTFDDPDALCLEGPVDPELTVLNVRAKDDGAQMGCLVNFTCHPAHHGGGTGYSAGWPGAFADEMLQRGLGTALFLNGALGQISTNDPRRGGADNDMPTVGRLVAEEAAAAVGAVQEYRDDWPLSGRSEVIELPFREPTEEQVKGTVRGAQRFIDPAIYDRMMPELIEEIRTQGRQPAEVQVLSIGDPAAAGSYAFVSIPAELFVELGLLIKERSHPRRAVVVGLANGMVGYVPTKAAFERGGYETTFLNTSKLAPEAGDMLVDCAVRQIKGA